MSTSDSNPGQTESHVCAFVTGGTRGIGRGVVSALAAGGAQVVFTGRDETRGAQVVQEAEQAGGQAHFVACDLSEPTSIQSACNEANRLIGDINLLCHCAGIYPEHSLQDMTLEDWRHVLDVNLTSAMLLIKASRDALAKSGRGRVVLISSITGTRTGMPGLAHYSASKAGIDGLVRTAAVELAAEGITVNAISPGSVFTEGLAELFSDPGEIDSVTKIIPAGRMGSPDDITTAVRFFARADTGFITGQNLVIDGGQSLPEVQGEL